MAGDVERPPKRNRVEELNLSQGDQHEAGDSKGKNEIKLEGSQQQQGLGMQALPRPPPLTIPMDGTLPIQHHHTNGMSPLPSFLNSPYLEGMMMSASPNLMAMYNQMANTTTGAGTGIMGGLGAGITPGGALMIMDGSFTPGSLLSPNLWPESTRSLGGNGAFKPPGELAGEAELAKRQQQQQQNGVSGSHRRDSTSNGGSGLQLPGPAPLISPPPSLVINSSPSSASVYKGIQFDKERGKWQVVVWDGAKMNVMGEYGNELEALVANELLSPATAPLTNLQAGGMQAFMSNDPRGPSIQEVLARASTSALIQQQGALISPLGGAPGGATSFSPLGALSPMGLTALLGGVPTPKMMQQGPKNYKGIRYHKERRQWQAYVLDDDKVHWLGFYNDEEEAARAHDAEALRRFGPSADINFSGDSPSELLHAGHSLFGGGYGGCGSSLLSSVPYASHVNMWGGNGELPGSSLEHQGYGYQQQPRRPGRPPKNHLTGAGTSLGSSGQGGRGGSSGTPGRGRGRGRGQRRAASDSSDFSPSGSESDDEPRVALGVSKRGRARKPSAMAAAVAATVAEESFGMEGVLGRGGSPGYGGGSGPTGPASLASSFSFPSGIVARVVSKFRGVTWDDESSKWQATAYDGATLINLGLFDSQEDAARAHDAAVMKTGRKERLNFPPTHVRDPSAMPKHRATGTHKITSQYKGVSWNSACSKWVAVLWDRELKRARHIGSFESEEDAARAYDREAIKMLGPDAGLNFRESLEDYMAASGGSFPGGTVGGSGGGHLGVAEGSGSFSHSSKGSSQYRGVSWHERSQRWEVRVWGGGKQHFIGSFTSEIEAARAYDKAVLRLRGQDARSRSRMNFPVSDYNLEEINAEPLGGLAAAMAAGAGTPDDFEPPHPGDGGANRRSSGRKVRRRRDSDVAGESDLEELDEQLGSGAHPSQQQAQAGAGNGSGAMALAAALGATGHGSNSMAVAAAALASLPAVTIYLDEGRKKWAAALVVAGNATVLGHCDNESSARSMAHNSLVAALTPVMGPSAAAAMATAAMNKNPSTGGGSAAAAAAPRRVSMDLGGPAPVSTSLSAPPSLDLSSLGGRSAAAGAVGTMAGQASISSAVPPTSLHGVLGDHHHSTHQHQAQMDVNTSGSPQQYGEEDDEDYQYGDEDEDEEGGVGGSARVPRRRKVVLAPSTVVPGGKPTMRGKSQYRGVSWCEKVRKWRALLWNGQKQLFLGHFASDTDAARAYDKALIDLKGPEAKTNFPTADYNGAVGSISGDGGMSGFAVGGLELGAGAYNGGSVGGSKAAGGPANVLNLALEAPGSGDRGIKFEAGGGGGHHHAVMHANYFMAKMDPLPPDLKLRHHGGLGGGSATFSTNYQFSLEELLLGPVLPAMNESKAMKLLIQASQSPKMVELLTDVRRVRKERVCTHAPTGILDSCSVAPGIQGFHSGPQSVPAAASSDSSSCSCSRLQGEGNVDTAAAPFALDVVPAAISAKHIQGTEDLLNTCQVEDSNKGCTLTREEDVLHGHTADSRKDEIGVAEALLGLVTNT